MKPLLMTICVRVPPPRLLILSDAHRLCIKQLGANRGQLVSPGSVSKHLTVGPHNGSDSSDLIYFDKIILRLLNKRSAVDVRYD